MHELPTPANALKGYAHAQQLLFEENMAISGVSDYHIKAAIKRHNLHEENAKAFLEWIKRKFGPSLFYYPMSGWHITPREVFGENNVVHLSNDQNQPFLNDIGKGIRVKGDVYHQPFKSDVFDAVFLRGQDFTKDMKEQGFAELRRVVKEDGLFIVEHGGIKNIENLCKDLQPANVPEKVGSQIKGTFSLFINRDREKKKNWW